MTRETSATGMAAVWTFVPKESAPFAIYLVEHLSIFLNLVAYHFYAFSTRVVPSLPDRLFASYGVIVHFEKNFLRPVKVLLNLEQTSRVSWQSCSLKVVRAGLKA